MHVQLFLDDRHLALRFDALAMVRAVLDVMAVCGLFACGCEVIRTER
jgi:hypothetical protein